MFLQNYSGTKMLILIRSFETVWVVWGKQEKYNENPIAFNKEESR